MKNPDLGEHRYMETSDGCRLHYVIKGPADQKSRLLICLHGFPGTTHFGFSMVLPSLFVSNPLSEHRRVLV